MLDPFTRRSLIAAAGATAVSSAAIPSGADASAAEDPELLSLGEELEEMVIKYRAQMERDARYDRAVDDLCRAHGRLSSPPEGTPSDDGGAFHTARDEFCESHGLVDDDVGEDGVSIAWDGIHEELFPLIEDILSLRPRTMQGLGIQARAISLSQRDLWGEEGGREWEVAAFVNSVCVLVGVTPFEQEGRS